MKKIIFMLLLLASSVAFAHEEHEERIDKGPHGGKLLTKDNFAFEVTIFEKGVPPQFRIFIYDDEKQLNPTEVKATITLTRFREKHETFELIPEGEFLTSSKIVEEPHSFKVKINANYKNNEYAWEYDSFEGRTELSDAALKAANLEFDIAGKRQIANRLNVFGRLLACEDRTAHIAARFPGIILDVKKKLGEQVKKGDLLASVESNQNLRSYEIKSFIDGTIVGKHATIGEFAPENQELFLIEDTSELCADFQIYKDDFGVVQSGQTITIQLGDETNEIQGKISFISSVIDEATQSRLVRVLLPNSDSKLKPGLFLSGTIALSQNEVAVAVKRDAIQTFRDWNVVYVTDGHVFQAIPVELGRRDGYYIEILSGIDSGIKYVSGNSFLIKADIEKSGATHDH